jgi:hypothetical protein
MAMMILSTTHQLWACISLNYLVMSKRKLLLVQRDIVNGWDDQNAYYFWIKKRVYT